MNKPGLYTLLGSTLVWLWIITITLIAQDPWMLGGDGKTYIISAWWLITVPAAVFSVIFGAALINEIEE